MKTTARVVVKRRFLKPEIEEVLAVHHHDPCRPGPTVGPISVSESSVYLWLGQPHVGEPIGIGPGDTIVITCEESEK